MNPAAILALLGDLYAQVAELNQEKADLLAALEKQQGAGDEWTHLPNGRRVTQVPNGEWVAADGSGWLPGTRTSADAWLTDADQGS